MANSPASRHEPIQLGEVGASLDATITSTPVRALAARRAHEVCVRQARRCARSSEMPLDPPLKQSTVNLFGASQGWYGAAGHGHAVLS